VSLLVDPYGRPLTSEVLGVRNDSWMNQLTGIGSYADKTTHGRFHEVRRITDKELTNLRNGSALAAKIIEKRPNEAFRRGYDLECDDVDQTDANDLHEYAVEELNLDEEYLRGQVLANQYGGALMVLGCDDGNLPNEPLDEDRIRTFDWVNVMDRRFAYVLDYYTDPSHPKCGKPQTYLTSNAIAGVSSGQNRTRMIPSEKLQGRGFYTAIVHESRCLRFEGVSTDPMTMLSLAGWTWSVLQRVYDGMRKFEHAFDSANYLLSDASQAVYTLKGLFQAISAGNQSEIFKRIAILEQIRSVMHGVLLDADGERFERAATPFGGIADLLDKFMLRFAADADMPVTQLFGRAASGLNAAAGSDSETRRWYDDIDCERVVKQSPKMRRAYRLLSKSGDCPVKLPATSEKGKPLSWKIKWKPLYQATDQEQADVNLKKVQAVQIAVSEGILSPEEGGLELQDIFPKMDVEAREKALKDAVTFDPHENDEPVDQPLVVPGVPGTQTGPASPKGGSVVAQPAATGPIPPKAKGGPAKTAAKKDAKRRR